MNAVITGFQPLGVVEATERLRQFVTHYRPIATALPCVNSFKEDAWDLRGKYFHAAAGNSKLSIRFMKLAENQKQATESFDQPFLDFAKAFSLHLIATNDWSSVSNLQLNWVPLLRLVEHGLRTARPSEAPCITALTEEVCEAVNAAIRARDAVPKKKSRYCMTLNRMVTILQNLGLCHRRFSWTGMVVKSDGYSYTKAGSQGEQALMEMLPSSEAMGSIAYCFGHAEGTRERWVSAINGLLAGQPSRLGECWFLRPDWYVERELEGFKEFGLRWWPEKKAKPDTKWFLLDDPFVSVFRQATAWLMEISSPAREIAKWYEKHPDRVYLPPELEHLRDKELLTVAEAASLHGQQGRGFLGKTRWTRRKGLQPVLDPVTGKRGIRFADLEKAILSDLPHGFPWFHRGKGLKHSEMLVILRKGEFHTKGAISPTMFAVPCRTTYYKALDAMVDRHGLVEANGSPVRIRSHQFRHALETAAYKAGVERAWMNRLAGRTRTSQEESYDDRTDAEKLAQTTGLSVRQRMFGVLEAAEPNRPLTHAEIMAEVELAKRTGYAHVTGKGLCGHDYTESPCRHFRDCLFCEDHMCIKGVPMWDVNIRAACAQENENLSNALEAQHRGMFGVKEHINNLLLPRALVSRDYLAILEDSKVPGGTEFKHIPQEAYDPITQALRNHADLERKAGRDAAWVERVLEKIEAVHAKRTRRSGLPDGGAA